MSNNNSVVSSNWPGFRRLWIIVAILLLILLLLLWLLGYGPGGKKCKVPPTIVEKTVEVEKLVDNPEHLSRITLLENENSKISGLQSKIKALESEIGNTSDLKAKISDLESENSKIAGLMTTLKGLKSENSKISGLMTTVSSLKSENSHIADMKARINELETENSQIANLMSAVKKLEGENTKIPSLEAKIKELENAEPKVKIVEKIVEKIVRVPAAPVAPVAPIMPRSMGIPETAKLYFDIGSSEFPADTTLSMAPILSYLKNNEDAKAVISGFHDASGNLAANKELSLKRAMEVANILSQVGISKSRMKIEEPKQTVGSGSPEEARRVEVKVIN